MFIFFNKIIIIIRIQQKVGIVLWFDSSFFPFFLVSFHFSHFNVLVLCCAFVMFEANAKSINKSYHNANGTDLSLVAFGFVYFVFETETDWWRKWQRTIKNNAIIFRVSVWPVRRDESEVKRKSSTIKFK